MKQPVGEEDRALKEPGGIVKTFAQRIVQNKTGDGTQKGEKITQSVDRTMGRVL